MKIKIFTVEEANKLIPILNSLLKDFQQIHEKMQEISIQWETGGKQNMRDAVPTSRLKRLQEEIGQLEKKGVEILKTFEQLGCVLRNPYEGIADFPGILDKNPIYLCWKKGEERIAFYHGVEEGFRGRKPLP